MNEISWKLLLDKSRYLTVLMRPDVAFTFIWAIVLGIYSPAVVNFYPSPNTTILLMIAGSIVIATGASLLLPRDAPLAQPQTSASEIVFRTPFILGLLGIWVLGFCLIIAYSGGLPIFWAIEGIDRYYYDYGIPTFSGAWNTLRIVIAILATIALVRSQPVRWDAIGTLVLLTLSVLAEVNRGGYVLYTLNLLAAGVVVAPSLRRQWVWVAIVVIATLGGVFGIGSIRSADAKATVAIEAPFVVDPVRAENHVSLLGDSLRDIVSNSAPISWIYLYLTSPTANLYLSATQTLQVPPFPGFYSLYPFLPSVVRPELPPEQHYPLPLASLSYTMATAYSSYVVDLGFVGSSVAMGLQLLLGIWIFNQSRRHVWAQILFPMFFAISVLSFFTNYFLTLLTPFHAALAILLGVIVPRLLVRARP